jgi:hypothetical protein
VQQDCKVELAQLELLACREQLEVAQLELLEFKEFKAEVVQLEHLHQHLQRQVILFQVQLHTFILVAHHLDQLVQLVFGQ